MTEATCSDYSRTFPPLENLNIHQVKALYRMACSNFLEPKTKTGLRKKDSNFSKIRLTHNHHFIKMIQPLHDRIRQLNQPEH
jgi:hypothetical protein